MVEVTPTLLKKPFLKNSKKFFREIYDKYHEKDIRDLEGNTLAHLSIYYDSCEYLPKVSHFLDIKNKEGVTPRDLAKCLGIALESVLKQPYVESLYVYRTQEQRFEYLSQEEIKSHFKIEYLDHLEFKCVKDLMWTTHKCKKKLLDPILKRKNHWIDSLYGTAFLTRRFPKTYIKWISPLIGYGLFSAEDIPQYSFIGEYTGVVRKRRRGLDKYNDYIFGYVTANSSTPFVIDAADKGNYTRFINHSDEPNLYSTWLIVKNICHVILVTKEAIPKDTQLTYDYGPTYWKRRADPLII